MRRQNLILQHHLQRSSRQPCQLNRCRLLKPQRLWRQHLPAAAGKHPPTPCCAPLQYPSSRRSWASTWCWLDRHKSSVPGYQRVGCPCNGDQGTHGMLSSRCLRQRMWNLSWLGSMAEILFGRQGLIAHSVVLTASLASKREPFQKTPRHTLFALGKPPCNSLACKRLTAAQSSSSSSTVLQMMLTGQQLLERLTSPPVAPLPWKSLTRRIQPWRGLLLLLLLLRRLMEMAGSSRLCKSTF
mmetsp:Transcript_23120/g.63837  ORF Transcript_23120/g.63837 Transcript_23120/m.63837 type:complete len:241 (+) Transcript_23120:505-1227(+)